MNNLQDQTDHYIQNHQADAVALLQALVREPSVQGNEAGVQQVVIKKLQDLGLTVDVWDPPFDELSAHPYFVASRDTYAGSPNVVGVLKGTGGGRSLILNGHIDVVPAGDRTKWTDDPFSGAVRDGKVYGRGTTDMKGGNVSMIMAMEALIRSGIRLKGDVIFHSVIEEETGGVGTLATLLRGYTADAALIPEPTNMKLFIAQQGSMWFRVTVKGVGAHAGTRYEGVSAVEKALPVYAAVMQLERDRNKNVTDPLYQSVPIPFPINIGKFNSGNWPSSVPDLAVFEGRIGVAPGESMAAVKELLAATIASACAADPWLAEHPAALEFFGGQWLPNAIPADHPFSIAVQEQFLHMYQRDAIVEASPWGTDAGVLGQAGGIPGLVIGPGETKMAHYPNEYISIAAMTDAARLFARVLMDWCGVEG